VKSTASSGLDATPDSSRPSQCPLAAVLLRQAPTPIALLRYRESFVVSQVRLNFSRFSPVPIQSLSSSRNPVRWCKPSRHCFRSLGRCRPTACWVCTQPLSLQAGKYPLAASIQRQDPTGASSVVAAPTFVGSDRCSEPFDLSARDFPRGVSRFPSPGFHLAVLRPP
jgi:hypothetical protein